VARVTPSERFPKPDSNHARCKIAVNEGRAYPLLEIFPACFSAAASGERVLKLLAQVTAWGRLAPRSERVVLSLPQAPARPLGALTEPTEVKGFLEDEGHYAPVLHEPQPPACSGRPTACHRLRGANGTDLPNPRFQAPRQPCVVVTVAK